MIYEMMCDKCKTGFEHEKSMNDNSLPKCPLCKSNETRQVISRPNLSFKGSGCYAKVYKGK